MIAPGVLATMQNKMKINDWSAIQSLFDELNKRLEKAQKVADNVGVPRVYVRMLVELEDFLTGMKLLSTKDPRLQGLRFAAAQD